MDITSGPSARGAGAAAAAPSSTSISVTARSPPLLTTPPAPRLRQNAWHGLSGGGARALRAGAGAGVTAAACHGVVSDGPPTLPATPSLVSARHASGSTGTRARSESCPPPPLPAPSTPPPPPPSQPQPISESIATAASAADSKRSIGSGAALPVSSRGTASSLVTSTVSCNIDVGACGARDVEAKGGSGRE
eukprot:364890-Chlamydomonas_euryale.AAC.6